MPDPNFTRINNVPYSYNSCAHFFSGIPYKGITGVKFKDTREVEVVHGAQQDGTPLGITAGLYKVEACSWTLLRDSAGALLADLTALGLGSVGDADFVYSMQHFEPTSPLSGVPRVPYNIIIGGCRITGIDDATEKGTEALVTEISFQPLYVIRSYGGVPIQLWSAVRSLLP